MPLIESPKHTDADREHWQRMMRFDVLLADSAELDRLVDQATRAIHQFITDGECVVGTSWGKDSVVLCHLVWQVDMTVPVGYSIRDERRPDRRNNPDAPAVRDAFLARFPFPNYFETATAEPEALREMNSEFGGRYISGVRGDESSQRDTAMKRHGLISANSCRPIGFWKAKHVWAYLARHDLPIHPAYAMTDGGAWNRDRIRVHSFGDTERGSGVGRLDWERRYFPEVWRDLDASNT